MGRAPLAGRGRSFRSPVSDSETAAGLPAIALLPATLLSLVQANFIRVQPSGQINDDSLDLEDKLL